MADICRREGYIALPKDYDDVQAAIRCELTEEGAAVEKKAHQLAQSALSSAKAASHTPFPETPEGVAGARCAALELSLSRR